MGGVFISYRREDTAPYAGRLRDALSARFGTEQVFRDLDRISPGQRFSVVIESAVTSCKVLIALIGPKWLDVRDKKKGRRLTDPQDYVRREIAGALRRDDVLFIPVLVAGATMPSANDLPPDLVALPEHHALDLTDDGWDDEVARLIEVIEAKLGGDKIGRTEAPPEAGAVVEATRLLRRARSGRVVQVAAAVAVVALAGTLMAQLGSPSDASDAVPAVREGSTTTAAPATSVAPTSAPPTTAEPKPEPAPRPQPGPSPTPAPPTPPPTEPPPPPPATTSTTAAPIVPGTCVTGYVWRETRRSDRVCVTPATRAQVVEDNAVAASRWVAGEYGPHTCINGYVWRDAFDGDDICVLPAVRTQAALDNREAASRVVAGG